MSPQGVEHFSATADTNGDGTAATVKPSVSPQGVEHICGPDAVLSEVCYVKPSVSPQGVEHPSERLMARAPSTREAISVAARR